MAKLTSEQIYGMGVKWVKKGTYTYKGKTYNSYNDMYKVVEKDYNEQNKSSNNQPSNNSSSSSKSGASSTYVHDAKKRLLHPATTKIQQNQIPKKSSVMTEGEWSRRNGTSGGTYKDYLKSQFGGEVSDPNAVQRLNERADKLAQSRTLTGSALSSTLDKWKTSTANFMAETEWRRRGSNGGTYQEYLDNVRNKHGINKEVLERIIGFDTINDDLSKVNNTVAGMYITLHDQESMASIRADVENIYNRLVAYELYRKNYGDDTYTDASEIADAYKSVVDDWGNIPKINQLFDTPITSEDYSSAVKSLQDKGVSGASGIMTESEWRRRLGKEGGTYQSYLDNQVGKYGKGNIDLTKRPRYRNKDNSISTVDSFSTNIDGKEVLLPTIVWGKNGTAKRLSEDEAIDHYFKTGEYLGKFDTPEEATRYAERLHEAQALLYPDDESNPRSANFWDVTVNSIRRGYNNSIYGQESFKAMHGMNNKKEEYEKKLQDYDYNFTPDNKFEEWTSGTMELIGQIARQWTDPTSVALGTSAAGAAAIAGQVGPQVALPEEAITVPGAFIAGLSAGGVKANLEIEAGHAYNEMVENGISPDVAKGIATIVGVGNAALEMFQLDDLMKSAKILQKTNADNTVTKKLIEYLVSRGVHVATETAQEVGQEGVTLAGVDIARMLEGKDAIYSWGDVGQRLGDIAASSAMSFAMLGAGGDVANYGINKTGNAIARDKKQTENAENIAKDDKQLDFYVTVAETSGEGTKSYEIAQEVKASKEKGEVTADQVKRLINATSKQFKKNAKNNEQTATDDVLKQAAKEMVVNKAKRSGKVNADMLDRLTADNQQIYVDEVKKVTGFGDKGARVVTGLANREGVTFSQAKRMVETAYQAGYSNVKEAQVGFDNGLQKEAFRAGKYDRAMDDGIAQTKAKEARVFDGAFTENEHTKNFTVGEKKMIATVAKALRMDVEAVDEILAGITYDKDGNEKKHYANAHHLDGKLTIASNRDVTKAIYSLVMHESGHRMSQLAPTEFGALMDALYQRAERRAAQINARNTEFGFVKAEHDIAGIDNMNTRAYVEEIAVRELETIFSSAEEFNKWYDEINGNAELKGNWQKFCEWVSKVIQDIKTALAQRKMSAEEKAAAKEELAELERIKGLLENAFKGAEKAATELSKSKSENKADTKGNYSLKDSNYIELAKDPEKNEAKLMGMVDAKAVESGVETDSNGKPIALYHGTSDFGFTSIDTEYSDDKLTFWATSEFAVAKSYHGHGFSFGEHDGVRQIGNPSEIERKPKLDYKKDSATKVVETASEIFPEYKDATVLTDKQKLKKAKKDIASALKTAKRILKSKELTESDAELVRSFIDAEKVGSCEALTKACDISDKIDKQRVDSWFDDDVSSYEERIQILTDKMGDIYEVVRPDYAIVDDDVIYTSYIAGRYNAATGNNGVYKFYYKAENPYVIDCKGVKWNQIETPADISPTGKKMNTREIAKWAFENGYDSVKYINAVDMGSKKVDAVSATVWAFMNPKEQLKSADAVTYDDAGGIIPLSKRFDKSNNDVRYSLKGIDGHTNGEESAIYINDGYKEDGTVVDFASAILDGVKKGETRNHKSLTRKWVGIAKDGYVIGRVRLGNPIVLHKGTQQYADSLIEGTEYDIKDGETKYYYPVEEKMDFRDSPRPILRHGNYGRYQPSLKEESATKLPNEEEQKVVEALNNVGVQVDSKGSSVAPSYSLKTWNESQYVQDKETAIKAIMKATKVSRKDAERYIRNINSIAKMIADDRERLDYDSNMDEHASVIKPNSEYKWTVDMSTLCAKRLLTTGTFDAIQKALPNAVFDSDDIVNLRSMLLGRGYEVACGICYVESTRRELGPITAEFIERYKESQKSGKPITRINSEGKVVELTKTQEQMETTKDKSSNKFFADKNYTPTLAELNTTDIDKVKVEHPLVYEAYLNFMNARGQAKPKLLETRAEYKGEILKHFKTANARNARNRAGGLRVQSFSDFEVAHLIDMMQIILDMSQVGLMSQAYTKVPAFADVFGGTGMKINLSLIAKDSGLDENGNLIFDDVEGMPHEEAFRLRSKYSKNVGTILVGKNDAHIRAALADKRIDFVIPFHKSSWKESLYDALGLTGYDDYTNFQNEKPYDKNREIHNFQPSEYWDYSKSGEENAKTYIKMCEEGGRIPKFPQFQNCKGYWKLLIDFKMYDNKGVGSPQMVVQPEFNMSKAKEILTAYEGGHRELPVAQDVVDDFVEQYKNKGASFSLKESNTTSSKDTKALLDIIEHLKGEFEVTKFAKADPKKLAKLTKGILKEYSSQADYDTTFKAIDDLYQYLANGEDGHPAVWDDVYSRAYDIAENIVEKALVLDNELYSQYSDLRQYLRNTPMKFDSRYDSVPSSYENFQDFRRHNWGRLNFTKDGTAIDKVYQELSDLYPEFFDSSEQMNAESQLERIIDVLDEIQPTEINPYSREVSQVASYLANDIIDRFFDIPQAKATFADKAERRVAEARIAGGKKVEAVRQQKDEKIKKLIESQKAKTKRQIDKLRQQRDAKVKKEQEKRREVISRMSESQKAKVLRAQITRHAGTLSKKLVNPTDNQHIPEELKGAVATLLESINLESNYTYDVESGRYKKNDNGLPTKRTKAFEELRDLYSQIKSEVVVDPDLIAEGGWLSDVIKLADKRIADMNSSELETVWNAVRAIEASVNSANKIFSQGKFATILEYAESLWNDNGGKKERAELKGVGGLQKLAALDMLTPETYFHYLGNSGDAIFRMMRDAQDKHISIMKEVADFTNKILKDVNVNKLEKTLHTVSLGGEDVKLSTAQLMELYVLMKREQAVEHILKGGILPDVIETRTKKITKAEPARNITMSEITEALSNLTDEQKKIADKLQKFVSTVLSDYGNEASMKVYNYEKFLEKNYWTIRTNKQEVQSDVGKDTAVTSVANKGMAKGTKPHANNSVRIGSIFDTFASHSTDMATYAAWLGTTEDVNRIRNFVYWSDGKRVGTVKGLLDKVHGRQGSKYLEKLLTDVSIGVQGTDNMNFLDKMTGAYKAASVGANIRVIIQQPTAILRATDMIDAHYLAAGTISPLKGWEKAKKYAPIAQWKDWGHFDINTGRQMKDVLFENASFIEKTKQAGMWGASMADSLAWGQLWNAVEAETKAKHKELEVGSDAYYETVAKRFTEIVDHTQVVDGIMQRSQIMRSPDSLTKMATSFMGEPTKQYNMAVSAAYDAKNLKGDARKKAFARLGKTAMSLAVAGLVNACAQSLVDALRDDDKEKDYWEKWLAAFGGNALDTANPLNYIPYIKDIVSIASGYSVTRMDTASLEKTRNAIVNMYKAITGTGKYTIAEAAATLFAEIGRMYGLPVANVKRDIKSIVTTFAIETDNYLLQYRIEKAMLDINYAGNNKNFMDILFNAYNNDEKAYELIYNDMLKSGYEVDKIKSGMESRMKKAEGVTKSSELEKRYMTPETEKKYDNSLKRMQSSGAWKSANTEQRKGAEADLYKYLTSDTKSVVNTLSEAKKSGIDETEYTLWQLALEMADQPEGQKGSGSYDYQEKAEAINMLDFSDEEIAYLFGKGAAASTKEEINETLDAGIDMKAYVNFKADTSDMKADKDANGKSITGSKQKKIVNYLRSSDFTDEEIDYFWYEVMDYKTKYKW